MTTRLPLTVAIPTYRRESVLLDTLDALLALPAAAAEILVVDQSDCHEAATQARLQALDAQGEIRWLRLPAPSITHAMNEALQQARQPVTVFLDDDIRPEPELLAAHFDAQQRHPGALIAGRVLQPWHEGQSQFDTGAFHFASTREREVAEFMGGNFSIRCDLARKVGGFDENFVRVAYRFEAEFAHRWRAHGHKIHFEPRACLHHLKAPSGGTRTFGEHLTTTRPDHAVGAYYYALRTHSAGEFFSRPLRSVATRYHAQRPWRIPATLIAEVRAMAWAISLSAHGPRLLRTREGEVRP